MPVDTATAPEQDAPNPYPSECDVVKGEAEVAQEGPRPLPFKSFALDVETSGLFDFKKPADDPAQPHLASIAMIFLDENLIVEREYAAHVRPDGWVMELGATAVNQLTTEFLLEEGVPIAEVLDAYTAAVMEGRVLAAHHAQNDAKMMRGELRRAGRDDLFEKTKNLCTMRNLVGVCRIPQKNGRGLKWPKLDEAAAHFHIQPEGVAHGALRDARVVVKLLWQMRRIGVMPTPEVHYAKHRPTPGGEPLRQALERSVEVERGSGYRIET